MVVREGSQYIELSQEDFDRRHCIDCPLLWVDKEVSEHFDDLAPVLIIELEDVLARSQNQLRDSVEDLLLLEVSLLKALQQHQIGHGEVLGS